MKPQNSEHEFSDLQNGFILLSFTRELIRHSGEGSLIEIENIIREQSKEEKIKTSYKHANIIEKIKTSREISDTPQQYLKNKSPLSPKQNELIEALKFSEEKHVRIPRQLGRSNLPALRIPMRQLPPRFQYLRPVPTKVEIDLEKLNPLLKDPMVRIIECNGVNKNIIVEGTMGRKKTSITLNRKEIEKIIYKFSEASKIPVHEGIFKVAVGRFIFTAIVSEIVDSKFIIKKMAYSFKRGSN